LVNSAHALPDAALGEVETVIRHRAAVAGRIAGAAQLLQLTHHGQMLDQLDDQLGRSVELARDLIDRDGAAAIEDGD
jgi:hypothetical protein